MNDGVTFYPHAMPDPHVTIVLRCFNEAWALRHTLDALTSQEYRNWQLIAVDSGSTDGSAELLRAANPRHLVELLPHDYRPGRVLNLGMELAATERVIFLNADATPQNSHWLRPLVEALQPPDVAAVFGRQVPRPDCHAVYASDYERCFGEKRESAGWDHFFSMVSSGLRKDIWLERGFLESMQYSEDDEYTRWCRSRGYRIVYRADSVVMHSHNYTAHQAYRRSFGEAWALAAVSRAGESRLPSRTRLALGWANDVRRDFTFCRRSGRLREWPHAAAIRWQQRLGRRDGFLAGWGMHGGTLANDDGHPAAPREELARCATCNSE